MKKKARNNERGRARVKASARGEERRGAGGVCPDGVEVCSQPVRSNARPHKLFVRRGSFR